MTSDEISAAIRQVLRDHFKLDPARPLPDDESFLGSGLIDSAGIIRLIGTIERRFEIVVLNDEIIAENFDSVSQTCAFIVKKLAR
jgi:acyl carrier protein